MDARRAIAGPRLTSVARNAPAAQAPPAGRFVGRGIELSELAGEIATMLAGRTRVRLIVGEAGIGKTRTAEEIARLAEREGVEVAWGRSHADAGEPPFWPWAQAIRAYATRRSDDELRAEIAGTPEVAEIAPVFRERLPELPAAAAPSSDQARFARFAGFATFLAAASARSPLLIVLDDLHWADEASLRLLRFVAREPMSARLLVIAALRDAEARRRPDIQSILADLDRLAPRLSLGGLDEDDVLHLVEASLRRGVARGLGHRVRKLTGGNPFFVAEVLRALVRRGGEASTSALDDLAVPAGARSMVGRRLELVTLEARRLLEIAAVIGERFDLDVLAAVAKLPAARADQLLDEARADSLVVGPSGKSQLAFVHALVREVLYDELPAAQRGRLHSAVARAIELTRAAALDSHVASLVRHYEVAAASGTSAARAAGRAVDCAMRAAEQALSRCAFEDAAAYLERALPIVAGRADADEVRAEILVRVGEARARGGDKAAARAAFSAAAELARTRRLWSHLARAALGFAGTWARIVMRAEPAVVELLEEVLVTAPASAAPGLRSRLQARLAMELASPASAKRRLALADEAVAVGRLARDDSALAFALTVRHNLVGEAEAVECRLATAREVIEIARRYRSDELAADGYGLLVRDHLEAGHIAEMDEALAEQAHVAERMRQPQALWHLALRRVMRALLAGRLGDAEELSDEAARLAQRAQVAAPAFVVGMQRAMIRREQGRVDEVAPRLLAATVGAPDLLELALLPAWLHASTGRKEEAVEALARVAADALPAALSGVDRLTSLTLTAETCHLLGDRQRAAALHDLLLPHAGRNVVLGNALAYVDTVWRPLGLLAMTLGNPAEAEEHLEKALDTYRRLGAVARRAHVQVELAGALLAQGDGARRRRALDLLADAARTASEIGLAGLERRIAEHASRVGRDGGATRDVEPVRPSTYAFRREGEYWSVAYPGGTTMRFRDARGMRQIAFLLARPGADVSVLDLVTAGDPRDGRRCEVGSAPPGEAVRSDLGDAGELLDERARERYRRRIRDLREQADEALACNDVLRASAAKREIDTLAAALTGAFGRYGRSRHVASHLERARVSTTRTVRDAIRRIADKHPQLGYHLQRTIKTGRSCSYSPPPGEQIVWQLH